MTLDDVLCRWDVLGEEALATLEDTDGFAELSDFWPSLNDCEDGADIFAGVHPVSGIPDDSPTD